MQRRVPFIVFVNYSNVNTASARCQRHPGYRALVVREAMILDTVGGRPLAAAIKGTQRRGVVAACGNAASNDLPLNVFPFILRGATLTGIDSATAPLAWRESVWRKPAGEWRLETLESIHREVGLDELEPAIEDILAGRIKGRTVVRLD